MTGTEDPEEPAEPETSALPAGSLSHIADLPGEPGTFLRSGHPVSGQLTEFMRRRGHPHPGPAARRGLTMTPAGLCLLHDLRRSLPEPPARLRPRTATATPAAEASDAVA
jgi:hypothetical protein